MTGVRLSDETVVRIDNWASAQSDDPSRAEAIRRLVELGLTAAQSSKPYSEKAASKASTLAADAIDRISDQSAPPDEQERRKRRLIKGPGEFRELRSRSRKRED